MGATFPALAASAAAAPGVNAGLLRPSAQCGGGGGGGSERCSPRWTDRTGGIFRKTPAGKVILSGRESRRG